LCFSYTIGGECVLSLSSFYCCVWGLEKADRETTIELIRAQINSIWANSGEHFVACFSLISPQKERI